MNKFAPFVKWLWEVRDVPFTFRVTVVTELNRPNAPDLPAPALTIVEAENLFQFLETKGLVFFKGGPDPSYLLNKVEAHKWKTLIADLKKPDWMRSWFFLKVSAVIWFIIGGFIGGLVGGYSGVIGKHAAESHLQKVEGIRATSPSSAQKPEQTPASSPEKK